MRPARVSAITLALLCLVGLHLAPPVVSQSSDELLLGRVAQMEEQLNLQLLEGGATAGNDAAAASHPRTEAASTPPPPRPVFTEGLLKTTSLPRGIYRNQLNSTFLEYHRNVHKGEVELHCKGGTCPSLEGCGSAFPNVRACFWPNMEDKEYLFPDQPVNCPKLSDREEVGAKGADPRCTHPGDNLRFDKFVPQYFEIKDVYLDGNGVIFNESLHFFRHGCFKDREFAYHANHTSVQHYHRLLPLLYQLGGAFYHTLIEVLPHFLLLAPLLRDNPGIPIALSKKQLKMYDSVLQPIVGIPSRDFNLVLVDDRNQKLLLHADAVYQPIFQACGRAAPGMWRELRRWFLVPPDGLPMFLPGFAPRHIANTTAATAAAAEAAGAVGAGGAGAGTSSSSNSSDTGSSNVSSTSPPPWTDAQMARLPASWLAVIARRHKSKRRIAGFAQLVDAMKQTFHPSRVYVFEGKLNLTQAKAVFNRAAVFVGLHGAGLANMVFMPSNASVFEIRPRGYPNPCYHHLAIAAQLQYHLILGNGNKNSELKFNHTEAEEVLRLIAKNTRAKMSRDKFESINLVPPLQAVGEEDLEAGGEEDEEEEDGNEVLTIPLELMADVTLKGMNGTEVGGAEEKEEEVKGLSEEMVRRMEGERVEESGELQEELKRADMKQVHVSLGAGYDKRREILNCTGSRCPDFSGRCERNSEVSACRMDEVSEEGFARPLLPINCPKKENLMTVGPEGRDESCSHRSDFGWYEPGTFQIYLLRGVYIDHEGHVFNKTTHFNREGCNCDSQFEYQKGTKVHKVKRLVNLAYYQGRNFYHGLIEWTPQLFLLSSLMHAHPTMPLLAIADQWDFYERISKPIIGLEQFAMNRLNISRGELFYADEVYLPLYQACGKASPSLWSLLRSHFLLSPHGLPIFPPTTWIQRPGLADPVNETEAATVPPDWMVLLLRRPSAKRSLDRWDELYDATVSVFTLNRVHVLNGSVPILKARSLFRRARLLVAGHGAAMANMVFMRPNMTVLEIRPDQSNNACYHHLAHACGLRYYLTFGAGDGESIVKIDLGKIMGVLKDIALTFPPLPGDEHPDNVSIFGDP